MDAVTARVRSAWCKFRELAPILKRKGASLRLKGKLYKACVQSVLTYGTETWATRVEDMQRLERNENWMVRWMCGVSLKDKKSTEDLRTRLGIEEISKVVRRGRLRWFGHVERKSRSDMVSACRDWVVEGTRGKGRGKKTWKDCVKEDMKRFHLRSEIAQDRCAWRRVINGEPSNPCWHGKMDVKLY